MAEITQRMDALLTGMEDHFAHLYCKADFELKMSSVASAPRDIRPQKLNELAEMFIGAGVPCEKGKPLSYYKRLCDQLQVEETARDVEKKIIRTLCGVYSLYPTASAFMQRIVDSIEPDTRFSAPLEVRILRRFVENVNVRVHGYFTANLRSRMRRDGLDSIDESLFKPGQRLTAGTRKLVNACRNLAEGNFISPASSKELLYLFAFAYGMRYYFDTTSPDYDVKLDVVKNLFTDYYCDNLARYIRLTAEEENGSSDREPAGMMINPKNFIDVLFVYYLNKPDLTVQERVERFYGAIDTVGNLWRERKGYVPEQRSDYENQQTVRYGNSLKELTSLQDESALFDRLVDGYYCDLRYTRDGQAEDEDPQGVLGAFELRFSTNTAYRQYCEILELTREIMTDSYFSDDAEPQSWEWLEKEVIDEMRGYGMYDNVMFINSEGRSTLTNVEEITSEFLEIMRNIKKRLNPRHMLHIRDATQMTRTKLIAAYYHFYCLENTMEGTSGMWRSFHDVYQDMRSCLNQYLVEAGYQPISPKNLYDVFVIFLAYCKINDITFDPAHRPRTH